MSDLISRDEVLKIAKRFRMYNYDEFVEEIKKIHSQPFDGQSRSMGEPLKRETSPTGGHKARLVSPLAPSTNIQNLGCGRKFRQLQIFNRVCKICGSLENRNALGNKVVLCEKCQGKVE